MPKGRGRVNMIGPLQEGVLIRPQRRRGKKTGRKGKGKGKGRDPSTLVQFSTTTPSSHISGVQLPKMPKGGVGREHLHRTVCSLTNPFCDAAFGSKWPDQSGAITIPFSYHYLVAFNSHATLSSIFAMKADWEVGYMFTTVADNGSTALPSWSAHTAPSALSGIATSARVVSAGFIGRVTSNAANTNGYAIIKEQTVTPTSTYTPKALSQGPSTTVVPLMPGAQFSYVCKPVGTGARDFHAASVDTASSATSDWTAAIVEVPTTGNATTLITFEVFIHMECQLVLNSPYQAIAKQSVAAPRIADIATKVHNAAPAVAQTLQGSIVTQVDNSITGFVKKEVESFLSDPLGWGESAFAALGL